MSKYVENNLGREEKIVLKAKKSWLCLIFPILIILAFTIYAIVTTVKVNEYSKDPYKLFYFNDINEAIDEYIDELDKLSDLLSEDEKQQLLDENDVKSWKELKDLAIKEAEEEFRLRFEMEATEEDIQGIKTICQIVLSVHWVFIFLISLLPSIIYILKFCTMDLAITNKRVVGKIGVFGINTLDIPIDKIDHVQIKANLLGRIFHYYSLKVISVGGSGFDNGSKENKGFIGIANAKEFKNVVTEAIEQHAQEARKAQADEIARAMGK